MAVVGSQKQEQKIAEMGLLAHQMYPRVEAMAFKGAFRQGVKEALKNGTFSTWEEVAKQPAPVRRRFFESILEKSTGYLTGQGLTKDEIEKLLDKLKQQNEKYLVD